MRRGAFTFCTLLLILWPWFSAGAATGATRGNYDPLSIASSTPAPHLDLPVRDEKRNREIPLRVYLPADTNAAPVVLFSHGLGGSKNGCAYLGRHWAARGYVAVFLQHPGSDDSVWRNAPRSNRMAAMNQAASARNFLLRVEDVPAVLDQLAIWQRQAGHELCGRLDLTRVGMSAIPSARSPLRLSAGNPSRPQGSVSRTNASKRQLPLAPAARARAIPRWHLDL